MKKILSILLCALLLLPSALLAEKASPFLGLWYSHYSISNGVITELREGEVIQMHILEDGKVQFATAKGAQLNPGGATVSWRMEGDAIVLSAEGEDIRFALDGDLLIGVGVEESQTVFGREPAKEGFLGSTKARKEFGLEDVQGHWKLEYSGSNGRLFEADKMGLHIFYEFSHLLIEGDTLRFVSALDPLTFSHAKHSLSIGDGNLFCTVESMDGSSKKTPFLLLENGMLYHDRLLDGMHPNTLFYRRMD